MQQQGAQNEVATPLVDTRGFKSRNQALERNTDDCPSLRRLVDVLEKSTGKLSSIPCIGDLFDEFQSSREISALLKREFRRTMFEMMPPPLGNSFILYQGPNYTLSCDGYDHLISKRFLTTIPCAAQMRLMHSEGEVKFLRYCLPSGSDMSTLDPKAKIELVSDDTVSDQNPRIIFNSDDVIELKGRGSMITLTLRENSMSPFTWAFDPVSLAPLFITVSDQSFNRWKILIELIVNFHGTVYESIYSSELLLQLGDHELHFLRWSACQALAKTDLATAKGLIGKLVDDPHSHVRRAACAAMKRVQDLEMAV